MVNLFDSSYVCHEQCRCVSCNRSISQLIHRSNEFTTDGKSSRLRLGILSTCDVCNSPPTFLVSLINSITVVGLRAFTTSQSAEAQFILFTRIFDIATADTHRPVHFHHIHGSGFPIWIADAHKGQALGMST